MNAFPYFKVSMESLSTMGDIAYHNILKGGGYSISLGEISLGLVDIVLHCLRAHIPRTRKTGITNENTKSLIKTGAILISLLSKHSTEIQIDN